MTNPKDIGIEAYDLFQKLGGGLCDEQECCLHGIGHELTDAFLHALASYKASLLKEVEEAMPSYKKLGSQFDTLSAKNNGFNACLSEVLTAIKALTP